MVFGTQLNYHMDGRFDYSTGLVRYVSINLIVTFRENKRSTGVKGKFLWKLSAWASTNQQGTGSRMMYNDQILDEDQQSKTYAKGRPFKINGKKSKSNLKKLSFF